MESISFQTACARELSLKFIYIYILRGCQSLRAGLLHQDSIFCASRTLGCFVPLGWALLFTLILSMRQGSIRHRSHSLPPKTRELFRPCWILCVTHVLSALPFM